MVSSPNLVTILMVEKTLVESTDYPTRTQLWKRLPKGVHYTTFKTALDYLEASNKIEYDGKTIVYLGDSDKFRKFIETLIPMEQTLREDPLFKLKQVRTGVTTDSGHHDEDLYKKN